MPSYFWLTSPGLRKPVGDDVPYTTQALRQDLLRLRNAWEGCQASRDRNAIYGYLTAVFDLVAWWTAEHGALERAHKALRLRRICPFDGEEPFAAIIRCTAVRPKLTSAPDPNGHACCGMRWDISHIPSRLMHSLSARAASTAVRRGLPAALRGLLPERLDCLRKQPCKMM
jgi:hypothetical protein